MSVNSDRSPLLLELRKTAARHTRHSNRRGRRGRPLRDAGESTRRLDLPLCQIGGRLSADVDLIDIDDERHIDEVDFPRSVMTGPGCLSDCLTRSYGAWTVLRQDGNELHIDDSKLQIDDFTLQIDDFTLQIGDSTLQIVDLTLLRASSKRRLDVTTRWIVDINDLPPGRTSISTIRNFKSAIRSFKSAIRNVPQWHASVISPSRSVIQAMQHSNQNTPSPKKGE